MVIYIELLLGSNLGIFVQTFDKRLLLLELYFFINRTKGLTIKTLMENGCFENFQANTANM